MSEGIEDINIQLIEFGGENGVQALVKLDKTYRITISNEEIQNLSLIHISEPTRPY